VVEYRAYTVSDDGRILSREDFAGVDDEQAIEYANRLIDGEAVELWSGPRLVTRLRPKRRPL
jgi:hypothetical protein